MKEPGRVTPGDGTSAFVVCQSPPLDEALVVEPDDDPAAGVSAAVFAQPRSRFSERALRKVIRGSLPQRAGMR